MFALLRHIGHTSRYEIPPRPTALRQHLDANPTALRRRLAGAWRHVLGFGNVFLKSIHFGALPAAVCVTMTRLGEQAQNALRAFREERDLPIVLLGVAAVLWAALAS